MRLARASCKASEWRSVAVARSAPCSSWKAAAAWVNLPAAKRLRAARQRGSARDGMATPASEAPPAAGRAVEGLEDGQKHQRRSTPSMVAAAARTTGCFHGGAGAAGAGAVTLTVARWAMAASEG